MVLLNRRGIFDPRWAFAMRRNSQGAMTAKIEIYLPTKTPEAFEWDPFASDTTQHTAPAKELGQPIYRGVARIQPNKDWRARRVEVPGEVVTDHAVRIDIGFHTNEIGFNNLTPVIPVKALVVVTHLREVKGVPTSNQLLNQQFFVRVVSESSEAWEKTLLCDWNPGNQEA